MVAVELNSTSVITSDHTVLVITLWSVSLKIKKGYYYFYRHHNYYDVFISQFKKCDKKFNREITAYLKISPNIVHRIKLNTAKGCCNTTNAVITKTNNANTNNQ